MAPGEIQDRIEIGGLAERWTGMTAFVRGVSALSSAAGSIV